MKRKIATILLFAMLASYVVPFVGRDIKSMETVVAAQAKSTGKNNMIKKQKSSVVKNSIQSVTQYINVRLKECEKEKKKATVSKEEIRFKDYSIPKTSGFKSYMPYTAITLKSSRQYKLQQQYATTGNYGIRMVNDRYCVAIGTFTNSPIGTYIDLILENDTSIPCIIGDFKADKDTDSNNIITMHNGCATEFIVNSSSLDKMAKRMGDISYCRDEWRSPVKTIRVYEKNVFKNSEN